MTALEIAMAGYLAFGQPNGNNYEAITKHAGLQVIHADGAVTLRLREEERGKREENGAETTVIRLKDERYPFEVTRYIRTWNDCAAVETWVEVRHEETGPVRLMRADSFAAPVDSADLWPSAEGEETPKRKKVFDPKKRIPPRACLVADREGSLRGRGCRQGRDIQRQGRTRTAANGGRSNMNGKKEIICQKTTD